MKAIAINNHQISVKEYQGCRVVTFSEIDSVHGRPEGTACRNFKANRVHFQENVDFFLVKPGDSSIDEIRPLKIPPKGITFLTESGYLMLVKSFTDPLAWQVQRALVDNYFHSKAEPKPEYRPKTWRGQPVITIHDLLGLVNIPHRTVISYYLRNDKRIHKGSDYFLLEGGELREFKTENPDFPKTASCVAVITKTGFVKLMRTMRIQAQPPEFFQKELESQLQLPAPEKPVAPKLYVQAPDSEDFQNQLCAIRRKITAVEEMLDMINMYNTTEATFKERLRAVSDLGMLLSTEIIMLRRVECPLGEYKK